MNPKKSAARLVTAVTILSLLMTTNGVVFAQEATKSATLPHHKSFMSAYQEKVKEKWTKKLQEIQKQLDAALLENEKLKQEIEALKKQLLEPKPVTPAPTPVVTPPAPTPDVSTGLRNGIFYWHQTTLASDADAILKKIASVNIGGGQKINEIYLNFSRSTNYATVLNKLHAQGFKVFALMGDSDWATPGKWNEIQQNYVTAIQKQLGGATGFDGIIFDVEPWAGPTAATSAWWASAAAPTDYSNFLAKWKQAIGSAQLYVTIANWHDVHHQANQKEFLQKVYASAADAVVIMDYSTSDYISRIKYEMTLSKPTIIAFETHIQAGVDTSIGFDTLSGVQKAVTDVLKTYSNVAGLAMHDETYLRFF